MSVTRSQTRKVPNLSPSGWKLTVCPLRAGVMSSVGEVVGVSKVMFHDRVVFASCSSTPRLVRTSVWRVASFIVRSSSPVMSGHARRMENDRLTVFAVETLRSSSVSQSHWQFVRVSVSPSSALTIASKSFTGPETLSAEVGTVDDREGRERSIREIALELGRELHELREVLLDGPAVDRLGWMHGQDTARRFRLDDGGDAHFSEWVPRGRSTGS